MSHKSEITFSHSSPNEPDDIDEKNAKIFDKLEKQIDEAKRSGELDRVMALSEELQAVNPKQKEHSFNVFGHEVVFQAPGEVGRHAARVYVRQWFRGEGRDYFERLRRAEQED